MKNLILILVVAFLSCKKKDSQPADPTPDPAPSYSYKLSVKNNMGGRLSKESDDNDTITYSLRVNSVLAFSGKAVPTNTVGIYVEPTTKANTFSITPANVKTGDNLEWKVSYKCSTTSDKLIYNLGRAWLNENKTPPGSDIVLYTATKNDTAVFNNGVAELVYNLKVN